MILETLLRAKANTILGTTPYPDERSRSSRLGAA